MKNLCHVLWCRIPCVMMACYLFIAPPVLAEGASASSEHTPSSIPQEFSAEIKKTITEILARSEFETQKDEKNLRYIGEARKADAGKNEWRHSLMEFMQYLASLFEFMLWVLAFVIVVLVIVYRDRWLGLFAKRPSFAKLTAPAALFGLDVRQESLPDDIPAAAMSLWSCGKPVEAMGLLYRGALAMLIVRHGVAITASATEGECLRRVSLIHQTELVKYFGMLTHAWQFTVYAHRLPESSVVKALCEEFNQHFQRVELPEKAVR